MKLNHRIAQIALGAACIVGAPVATLLSISTPAYAQQAAGSITGIVQDSTGSAVAGATVTARDTDRNTTWTAITSSAGVYEFPQIPIGNLQVKAEAPGFAAEVRSAFPLLLNQVARVDFTMKVGKVSETVIVSDASPLLQTASTEVSTVLDANAVSSLPMASRNLNQLTLLAPGVISPNIFAFQSPQTTFGTGRPYVNGAREQDNNSSLDGMDVNQPDNNDVAYVPSPEAVEQFNIITSNAPADFGNYIGGVIVESIKSGTNHLHGSVYEYFRNTILDANSWQDKANASVLIPSADNPDVYVPTGVTLPRSVLQWNNFGGTLGGPIVRDKLFFFADFQGEVNNTPRTAETNNVIPASFLTGDLSSLCTSQGASFVGGVCSNPTLQLYSPVYLTGPNAGQIAPLNSRQPFLNNQIPINSTVAGNMVASPLFTQQFEQQQYFTSGFVHSWQGDVKIDWQASPKDHLMGRYSQMYTINTMSNGTNVLTPNLTREYPLKNFVINYVRTITPSLVNEVRVGAQIFPANDQIYTNATGGNLPEEFGLPGVQTDILPAMSFGYGTVGNADGIEVFHDTTYEAEDSITWTHGKHSLHAGFEFYHYMMNDVYAGNQGAAGAFNFSGQYSSNPNQCITANGVQTCAAGNAFADFLLGLPQQVQQGVPFNFHLRNSLFAGFAQDNWKVTPNLTLNLGLRYELTTPRGDKDGNNNVNFDLLTGTPQIGTNYNTYTGIGNVQPRVGFAWQPSWAPNTVLRGAYDISSYMEGNGVNNMAVVNPPNVELHNQLNNSGDALLFPVTTLDQGYTPFSAACTPDQLMEFAPACFASGQVHATNPNLRPAVDQQWSLFVQQQFGTHTTFTIGYVGNKDDHMADIYLYNQKQIDSTGAVVSGPYMQPIVNAGAQARYNASDGISRFNALEATVVAKDYHGLDVQANYTWSKCMANSLGYFGSYGDEEGIGESQTQATQNFFQNEYDPKADYGRCTIDVSQSFNAYGIYNLPFGRGKKFAGNANRAVNAVIGGWKTALDVTFRSGFGITPFAGAYMGDQNPNSASTLTGSYQPRPDCVVGVSGSQSMQTVQIGGSIGKTNLNPAAVSEVADLSAGGTFGNCQNGSLRGPSLKTADLNLSKSIPVTEKVNLAVSAQFINLTNTPIFSVPASWWGQYSSCGACNAVRTTGPLGGGSGTVGQFGLLDGSNPGRQIELSMKLNF
jgi:Carboxypeptidase regulatory-like domain/TonB dependent receptor/TonB-dependent Receptor Plug Domain